MAGTLVWAKWSTQSLHLIIVCISYNNIRLRLHIYTIVTLHSSLNSCRASSLQHAYISITIGHSPLYFVTYYVPISVGRYLLGNSLSSSLLPLLGDRLELSKFILVVVGGGWLFPPPTGGWGGGLLALFPTLEGDPSGPLMPLCVRGAGRGDSEGRATTFLTPPLTELCKSTCPPLLVLSPLTLTSDITGRGSVVVCFTSFAPIGEWDRPFFLTRRGQRSTGLFHSSSINRMF